MSNLYGSNSFPSSHVSPSSLSIGQTSQLRCLYFQTDSSTWNLTFLVCLTNVVDEVLENKSPEVRDKIKKIFDNKQKEQHIQWITNLFSKSNLEFYNSLTDEELINYLKVTA